MTGQVTSIQRFLAALAVALLPGVSTAQSLELGPMSISSWNMCDELCATSTDPNQEESSRRVRAKDVLRAVVGDMVDAQVTLNLRKNNVKLLSERSEMLRYRVRLALAYQGAQVGFKSVNSDGLSLSVRNSPADLEDSEVYTHLRFEMAW